MAEMGGGPGADEIASVALADAARNRRLANEQQEWIDKIIRAVGELRDEIKELRRRVEAVEGTSHAPSRRRAYYR